MKLRHVMQYFVQRPGAVICGRTAALVVAIALAVPGGAGAQSLESILHNFGANSGTLDDGAKPTSALVLGPGGNFFGTTPYGGSHGYGTVYQITPSGNLTTLHSFDDGTVANDGMRPYGSLILGSDGNFYGLTSAGGSAGNGTVFSMTAAGAVTIMHSFGDGSVVNDGTAPQGALIQGTDGNFYGTTPSGGSAGNGTVFSMTTTGVVTIVHSFGDGSVTDDGADPQGIIQGSDGNFYGTTEGGGSAKYGTVYRVTTAGQLSILHSFYDGTVRFDGQQPVAPLVEASSGIFYGTTEYGGMLDEGTLFRIASSGVEKPMIDLESGFGVYPLAPLIQGADGNLYGTAQNGGYTIFDGASYGTAFQLTPDGAFYVLHDFNDETAYPDGYYPQSALVQGPDGSFYGTTLQGGLQEYDGTIFKLSRPTDPVNLNALGLAEQVSMCWTASEGAGSYNIYRGTRKGQEGASPVAASLSTCYADTGLAVGQTYYYTVAAVNLVGTSEHSNEASATPAPFPPTNLTATAGHEQVILNWIAGAGDQTYDVYRGTFSGGELPAPLMTGIEATSYTDTGLFDGTTYYYYVVGEGGNGSNYHGVVGGGSGVPSSGTYEVSATPTAPIAPAPANLKATAGNATVVLTWQPSSGGTSYNIYRDQFTTPVQQLVITTSFTDTGLPNGNTYYYKVVAINTGGTSAFSNVASATPTTSIPSTPLYLTAAGLPGAIGLTWSPAARSAVYDLYCGVSPSSLTKVTSVSGNSYVDSGLEDGVTYYYRVAGVDWVGPSVESNLAHATPHSSAETGLLVAQNSLTRQLAFWRFTGPTLDSETLISDVPTPGWNFVGCADFNGDEQPDLLFQEASTGDLAVWYMNGTTRLSVANFPQSPAAAWRVVGVGDFNGDGHPDLCLQNSSTGQVAIWLLNGLTKIGGAVLPTTPGAGWAPVAVGDFNSDGYADILFQQTVSSTADTYLAVWYMQGTTRLGIGNFARQAGPGKSVAAVDNLTAAVEPNIVLESGSTVDEWTLSGVSVTGSSALSSTVPSGWSVVGPR